MSSEPLSNSFEWHCCDKNTWKICAETKNIRLPLFSVAKEHSTLGGNCNVLNVQKLEEKGLRLRTFRGLIGGDNAVGKKFREEFGAQEYAILEPIDNSKTEADYADAVKSPELWTACANAKVVPMQPPSQQFDKQCEDELVTVIFFLENILKYIPNEIDRLVSLSLIYRARGGGLCSFLDFTLFEAKICDSVMRLIDTRNSYEEDESKKPPVNWDDVDPTLQFVDYWAARFTVHGCYEACPRKRSL
eukprot:CAMPEP_0201548032 /NCGR_PEP_ID=MMETSP0173_2-20130828/4530_1 /ASSEMBLY_ACC=CAM_ASM_000268 /TAXON_ID=218659 /ORGANISM="Vexillifera sp., Strain DIVA3 564/2" /LENGTH=245 /DNA_ID=CAMNT_0047957261 /DNA_START=29 /DNA_END=766 /DNA_ORIENTATION=-